eukprot:TRINITY_DN11944_c0_g1_i1.p1 TRINITY_DN11944_c0_g1~~TRINITY_DN11944_c0_g1_i1.p1  ORF type:complete len:103 (+),score=5.01 TRINITY_DN11944_c0_g1_i1:71-379(+)
MTASTMWSALQAAKPCFLLSAIMLFSVLSLKTLTAVFDGLDTTFPPPVSIIAFISAYSGTMPFDKKKLIPWNTPLVSFFTFLNTSDIAVSYTHLTLPTICSV